MITSASPIRPDSPYGVGKAAGEAAARFYAHEHGLSVICLRLGSVYPSNRPGSARGFATMLTHGDLFRLVRACIAAPRSVGFGIIYGVSANTWRFWDVDEGRRLVGYEPVDDSEAWR
jgi:uronate dehydrogenase